MKKHDELAHEHLEDDDHLDDRALRATAQRLGRLPAERLDVEAIVQAVTARLRERKYERRWLPYLPSVARVAAVVALVVGGVVVMRGSSEHRTASLALPTTVELAGLGVPDLERLLGSLDEVLRGDSVPVTNDDLDDLTADQLQAVLQSLEG